MELTVQSLWVGDELSAMERLSISSFLAHGHQFDLYTYGPLGGIPNGVRLRDAAEILPRDRVFLYRDYPSYAGFANFFRYKLLLERGGWWVDLDAVCLRPFDFDQEYVFASEGDALGRYVPTNGFIKAPAGCPLMAELWQICQARDPTQISWGETGPFLIQQNIGRFGLEAYVQDFSVFCPIHYFQWQEVLDPTGTWAFPDSTRTIHLWNEMWRRAGQDKDFSYDPDCLYEKLKTRYGVKPTYSQML